MKMIESLILGSKVEIANDPWANSRDTHKGRGTKMRNIKFGGCAIAVAASLTGGMTSANAAEAGTAGMQSLPGLSAGGTTAGVPDPGIYMFDTSATYQAHAVGPGAPKNPGGVATSADANLVGVGFLWVPGWTFLGAKYDAVLVNSATNFDIGAPINVNKAGLHNTLVVPFELSWKLGDSGFFVKTGLGIYTPDGTTSGANGNGSIGNPFWTFKPEFIISYLKDGWNLTASFYEEFNTANRITGYTSGNQIDFEFAATKRIGNWTVGPLAYYVAQVTNDKSSAFYANAINYNRSSNFAVGGLVGYDFGKATLTVWALDQVTGTASGGTLNNFGVDRAATFQGWQAFARLSYKIWSPEPDNVKPALYHK
jgi:hypothetical protein